MAAFLTLCYLPPRVVFADWLGAGLTPAGIRWIGGEALLLWGGLSALMLYF